MSSPCSEILSIALNVLPSSRRAPPRVVPRIWRSPLARCCVVLGIVRCLRALCGLHLFALALDLPREEVVEHRSDNHNGRQDLYLGDRRRHCRAEDVRTKLELQPQGQVASQERPDLCVGAFPYPEHREQVNSDGREGAEAYYRRSHRLDGQFQVAYCCDQKLFHDSVVYPRSWVSRPAGIDDEDRTTSNKRGLSLAAHSLNF